MKFNNLHITTKNSETYLKVTNLLKVKPKKEVDDFSLWTYQIVSDQEKQHFDYINRFLNLLEPNFGKLKDIGIEKDKIVIWLFYEYNQQCSMSFNPQEMKRLGESGIKLNIDCLQNN